MEILKLHFGVLCWTSHVGVNCLGETKKVRRSKPNLEGQIVRSGTLSLLLRHGNRRGPK